MAIKERSPKAAATISSPQVQTGKQKHNKETEEQLSEYERGRNEHFRENREYLKRLFHTEPDYGRKPKRRQANRATFNPQQTIQHNQVVITRNPS